MIHTQNGRYRNEDSHDHPQLHFSSESILFLERSPYLDSIVPCQPFLLVLVAQNDERTTVLVEGECSRESSHFKKYSHYADVAIFTDLIHEISET